MTTYGYCRISTPKQNIDRQVRNILALYPNSKIIKETFTGKKFQGRKELDKMLKGINEQDTIVFDSVSRMSRNADEAMELYEELFKANVNLVFLKEAHVNTDVYRQAINNQIKIYIDTGNRATDDFIKSIIDALNRYTIELAKQQIRLAFEQAEKEVTDLSQRTKEGIETARLNGKQIGQKKDAVLTVKKAIYAKEIILKHNKTFGGMHSDIETQKLCEVSRNSLYLYKRELKQEIETTSFDAVVEKYTNQVQKLKREDKKNKKTS